MYIGLKKRTFSKKEKHFFSTEADGTDPTVHRFIHRKTFYPQVRF